MNAGERRKLVFTNLVNGFDVADVMVALHLSEKEVKDDFAFVSRKLTSYRFERGMPYLRFDTIEWARTNRIDGVYCMARCNLDKDPAFSRIEAVKLDEADPLIARASARARR